MALAGLGGGAPPVVVGTMDAWANLFGSGVHQPGQGIYVSGTSEIIGLVSRHRQPVDGIVSFLPIDGRHVHAGPTQCGGDALRWFAAAMERSIEDILAFAGQAGGDSGGVVFLPHMMGERAPVWDPAVRGGFVGLGGQTGLAQLSLAVLEGVAFSARWLFEAASQAAGRDYRVLIHSGKGSQSDLWCQIRADVLGVTLDRVRQQDTGVVGAAMLAGVSAGHFASWAQASEVMVQIDRRFRPERQRHNAYARHYEFYRQTYDALAPLYHARGT
jgi:xylulokinase